MSGDYEARSPRRGNEGDALVLDVTSKKLLDYHYLQIGSSLCGGYETALSTGQWSGAATDGAPGPGQKHALTWADNYHKPTISPRQARPGIDERSPRLTWHEMA